jgi:endonuclease-3
MQELVLLPGVARKTANVVLCNAFNTNEGIAVDTHVKRLSGLLGLSRYKDPEKIEKDLMATVPRDYWGRITYLLIEHGRQICIARRPKCCSCVLSDVCPSAKPDPGTRPASG